MALLYGRLEWFKLWEKRLFSFLYNESLFACHFRSWLKLVPRYLNSKTLAIGLLSMKTLEVMSYVLQKSKTISLALSVLNIRLLAWHQVVNLVIVLKYEWSGSLCFKRPTITISSAYLKGLCHGRWSTRFGVVFPIFKGRQLRIHSSDKPNIGHSNNYGPNGPNRNKMWSNY